MTRGDDPSDRPGNFGGTTVLITGGAGFIGSGLAASLAGDAEVRVFDSLAAGDRDRVPDEATLIEGDIRDEDAVQDAMEGVDVAFHLAAIVDVERSIEVPEHSYAVNVEGTLHVLEAARREDARVVLASSAAIYGEPENVPIAETASPAPSSPYGLEKLTVDRYGALYHDLYGVETVRLRPFNVYGPGQRESEYAGVISIFLEQAMRGDPITVEGDGTQTRDFVHVRDVVRAFRLAGVTDHVGEAFNVGTGRETSIRDLAELVRDVTAGETEIVHTEPREGDIEHSCADMTRARGKLGFDPRIDLDDGLQSMARHVDATSGRSPRLH